MFFAAHPSSSACPFAGAETRSFHSLMVFLLRSPQEASGAGRVGRESSPSRRQRRRLISSRGIISADAPLSSHCVETLVSCQTAVHGAPDQNTERSGRGITGRGPVLRTGFYSHLLSLCLLLKVTVWLVLDISCRLLLCVHVISLRLLLLPFFSFFLYCRRFTRFLPS